MSEFFVHSSSLVDAGAEIGRGTKIWHFSHISKGVRIGRDCVFGQNVFIAPNVIVGDFCKVQNNVSLYEGVVLEDYVFCGPSCVFTNVKTPRCLFPRNTSGDFAVTRVKRGSSIGANATIVCGITLHEHSFVAAGAVVTKDVAAFTMVAGCPAVAIGYMGVNGDVLEFGADGCAEDSVGNKYVKNGSNNLSFIPKV